MPFLRTKSATVADPLPVKCPVVMGYCGVDSAELGRVRAGDLGRSETPLQLPVTRRGWTRYALGKRAQIGLAYAARRVNVSGLYSWLALVEQPPRTDEDSETQDIARTFPLRSAQALETTKHRIERDQRCAS
jgi:hypothetical protein